MRVHFPAEQIEKHDAHINVQTTSEKDVAVHLGFLQMNHHYEVKFTIKDDLSEDVIANPLQNIFAKIISVMPSEDGLGHDIVLDLAAHKERLMKEELRLNDANDKDKFIDITLHARVLGKGKGTPFIKVGIHCTGVDIDEESEGSDWQGFHG